MERLEINKVEQNLVKRIGNVIALTDKLLTLNSGQIRIFIANDNILFIQGIKKALENFTHIIFVGQAGSLEEVFGKFKEGQPDILITHDLMSRTDIIIDLPKIKTLYPNLKIILNTSGAIDNYISIIIGYVNGYVSFSAEIEKYVEAFEKVYKGGNYFIKNEHGNGKLIKTHLSYNKDEFVSIIKSII